MPPGRYNHLGMPFTPRMLVHGGAWAIPDAAVEAHLAGVRHAAEVGWRSLAAGGSAIEAVECALVEMENDDTFDAGRGSFLTADGRVQLDALLMEGAGLRAGGVGCVERLAHPIRAARLILERSPHVYLVGTGAEEFAAAQGLALCDNSELVLERERERLRSAQNGGGNEFGHDTVGAIALDGAGHLACGNSTGGTLNKAPGRVGDASLIGCGCYADDAFGAAVCTGWGEPIMRLVLAKWATDRLSAAPGDDAVAKRVAHAAIAHLQNRLQGVGGIILMDAAGRVGMAHNTPRLAWARRDADGGVAGVAND